MPHHTCVCLHFTITIFKPYRINSVLNGDVISAPERFLALDFFFFFFNFWVYLFIYGCVGSSFLCEGFLQLRRAGAALHRGARASHRRGLSCCGAQAPDAQAQ